MLKSNLTNVDEPIWDLMMKNIYSLGASQLRQEDFKLDILYTDPSPVNFITGVLDFHYLRMLIKHLYYKYFM